ncbi:MAG TPA: T9SS type A sorting domain-containing protein, partial [Puia sp.]|nr:T9SS type A sorting domain-containing protein [Puia sp.]
KLDWETAAETNSNYFTILRSRDATQWNDVLVVPAHGNSNAPSYYQAYDNDPYPGVSYYRLAQTDDNGNVNYSEVCVVNVAGETKGVAVYPNPADDHVVVVPSTSGSLTVQIVDARGMAIGQPIQSTGSNVVVSVRGLAPGVYFLRTLQGARAQITPIVIRR